MQETDYRAQIEAHRKQWIDALRSGNYKQGGGYLHRQDKDAYCCLGVACKLAGTDAAPRTVKVTKQNPQTGRIDVVELVVTVFGSDDKNESVLPNDVMEWLGLLDNNPVIDFPNGAAPPEGTSVAELNDKGWSFDKIADAIEAYGFISYNDALKEPLNA